MTVYNKCNGHCAYCGEQILITEMHVDHVKALRRKNKYDRKTKKWERTGKVRCPQNDTIENMLPACAPCNLWKHSMTLEKFRKSVATQAEKLYKKSPGVRLLFRFGVLEYNDDPIKFYFETMLDNKLDVLKTVTLTGEAKVNQ